MARGDASFQVSVLAEKGVIFEGECEAVFAPGAREPLAILAHHTPMIAKLGAGEVIIRAGKSRRVVANVETGLLYVGDNEVTILVDL